MIKLELPSDVESRLAQQAAVGGQDVSTYVAQAVQRLLVVDPNDVNTDGATYDQWRGEFQAWLASQRSRNPHFDDSRESLYD
ncbi:MAG: hypothetical protein ABI614_12985 [Planctomycetota bacterium]